MKSLMQKMTGKMMLSLSLVVSTSLNTGMDIHAQELSPRYLDTSLSFEERAADLVSRMTLEEKVSQMVTDADAIPRLEFLLIVGGASVCMVSQEMVMLPYFPCL